MCGSKPILLVEDGRATAPTVGTVLDELGISYGVVRVSEADEALVSLGETPSGKPSVILVDSSSGQANVLDLVRAVKQDERLNGIPVIVLTPSGDARVVNESFELGAAGYVVKPSDRQEFVEVLRTIHRYWTLSRVPSDVGRGLTRA